MATSAADLSLEEIGDMIELIAWHVDPMAIPKEFDQIFETCASIVDTEEHDGNGTDS